MSNKIGLLSVSLLMGLFLVSCNGEQVAQNQTQVTSTGADYQITVPTDCNLAMRAAERLQSCIGKTSGQTPKI